MAEKCLVLLAVLYLSLGKYQHVLSASNETSGGCSLPGTTKTTCQEQCAADGKTCSQKTVIDACSCASFASQTTETATFSLQGQLLSSKGYGLVEKCDKCSVYCSKVSAGKPAQRSYVKAEGAATPPCQQKAMRSHVADHANLQYKERPTVVGRCQDKGNMTRLCREKCSLDEKSCQVDVLIDACTCGGRSVKLKETAVFDMKTMKRNATAPFEYHGYSRVCGDCIEFCAHRPGEENQYYVNTFITTCFDAKEATS